MMLCTPAQALILSEHDSEKSFFITGVATSARYVDYLQIYFVKHFENEQTSSWIRVISFNRKFSAIGNLIYIDEKPFKLKPIITEDKYHRMDKPMIPNTMYFEITPEIAESVSKASKISFTFMRGKNDIKYKFSSQEVADCKTALNSTAVDFEKYLNY